MILFEPEPDYSDIEPFARCASCGELIKLEIVDDRIVTDERNCPSCRVFIKKDEIKKSLETHAKITRGLRSAKEIVGGDWRLIAIFALVLVEMSVAYYIRNKFMVLFYPVFLISIVLLFSGYFKIQKWLDKFGYMVADDEEFRFAKSEMNRSRMIWLAAIVLSLFLWFIRIKFI